MNLDEIISYQKPKDTYYDLLGCDQSSSVEQINKEYKIKALQLHPDKNSNSEATEKFRLIQEAKDILSNESSRRSYDHWLNSRICISFEQWQNRKAHSMMHWATPRPTKLSIQENNSNTKGQGSDEIIPKAGPMLRQPQATFEKNNLLEKFRRYEI